MSYGLLNWVVAFFTFVFDKNKSIRTIFFWSRKNREYRYIHSSFFMELFLLSFQDMISNIIRGGYSTSHPIYNGKFVSFDHIGSMFGLIERKFLPVISFSGDEIIGIAYQMGSDSINYDEALRHCGRWKFENEYCIDCSVLSSENYVLYQLSKYSNNILIHHKNRKWRFFDADMEKCFGENNNSLINRSDFEKQFLMEVLRNEWCDLKSVLEELDTQGISSIVFEFPKLDELQYITKSEEYRAKHGISGYTLADTEEHKEYLSLGYRDDYDLYCQGKLATSLVQYARNGLVKLKDYHGEYVNVTDGKRVTVGAKNCSKKLYILGPCIVGGAYVTDQYTIPSILQDKFNKEKIDVEVINLGTCGYYRSYVPKLQKIKFNKEDTVIIFECDGIGECIPNTIRLDDAYKYREDDIFFETPYHMNKYGNSIVSDISYESIKPIVMRECLTDGTVEIVGFDDYRKKSDNEVQIWADKINKYPYYEGAVYGSIVMNCNPLTFGHKWLIEQAIGMVDYLYIFVVEENKSEFSFEERYEMVTRCAEGISDHIRVIPSGRWVLSDVTMPEYFTKERNQNVVVSVSDDLELFAEDVAPIFHITKRFVGEEKSDLITKQYNEGMKRILPQYGIELVEIPRKKVGNDVISATTVRRAMKKNDWESISALVPDTTMDIIRKHVPTIP